jgi:hypothetical protein
MISVGAKEKVEKYKREIASAGMLPVKGKVKKGKPGRAA